MSGAVIGRDRMKTWTEQALVNRALLIDLMQEHIRFAEHPLPEGMIGHLYCIDGIPNAASAIMDYLDERARIAKEKENGEEG